MLAVDDEPPALDELVYLLGTDPRVGSVAAAGDATEALRLLRDGEVEAVFLDIRMPGLDGLELARVLRRFASPPTVVFVTAHDDRAVDAYDLGAVYDELAPALRARLHTADTSHLIRVPLSVLAERWADAGFVRIHRSYLVALRDVRELRLTGSGYVVRTGDRDLPVSRRHTRELKDRLIRATKAEWTRS